MDEIALNLNDLNQNQINAKLTLSWSNLTVTASSNKKIFNFFGKNEEEPKTIISNGILYLNDS